MIKLYELIKYYKREIIGLKFTGKLCSRLIGVLTEDSNVLNTILLPDKMTQTNIPGGYKTFFLLNSTEYEISTAYQKLVTKYKELLSITYINVVFIMLINVKMPTIRWHFNIYEHDKVYAQLS